MSRDRARLLRGELLALALALVSSAGTIVSPASAQTTSSEEDARLTFKAARALYDEGHFAEALPRFQSVAVTLESPNARLFAARCLRELGRLPEAYEEMGRALVEATELAKTEARYAETRDAAAVERTALEARVGRVLIVVQQPPGDLEITVGGRLLKTTQLGELVAAEVGSVEIVATAPGFEEVRRDVELAAGSVVTLPIELTPHDASPSGGDPTPSPTVSEGGEVRIAGFVVAGVGVAGMATFVIAGLAANGKYDTLEERCAAAPCTDEEIADDVDTGETLDTVANVGLIVGAAGIAAGALMIAFGGPTDEAAVALQPMVAPDALGVAYRGRF